MASHSKEYKQLILQQLVKEIKEETTKAKNSYGVMGWVIKEQQKDFSWINWNMVNYVIQVSILQQGNKQQPAASQHIY